MHIGVALPKGLILAGEVALLTGFSKVLCKGQTHSRSNTARHLLQRSPELAAFFRSA